MIIGIDGNEANEKFRVGVHQMAYWTLKTLVKLKDEWKDTHRFIIYLKNPPRDDMPKEFPGWEYRILPGEGMWILKKLMPYLFKNPEPSVFYAPSHYLPPFLPMPMVCAITDLGYLANSAQFTKYDFWQLKHWSAISMWRAKKIVTISESTKKDILKNYSFQDSKIISIPLGYDNSTFNSKVAQEEIVRVKKKYKITEDYILFLSTLKPSKNIEGILTAYKLLENANAVREVLVIAGKKGWMYNPIFSQVKKLGLEKKVQFTDFIDEEDKAPLLSGAKLFVAPSFWEGFGIHVLEALACGTPVVISDIASLPEVGGKAAIYCDPYKPETIAKAMDCVLSASKVEYNKIRKASIDQAAKFSWETTAREILHELVKAGEK